MKKNKIAIFATIALLVVGTAFGTRKLHKKDMETVYYILNGTCTPINCSALTGPPYCVSESTVFYSKKINGVCTDIIATGLRPAF
jgi:hypothetical protein